MDSSIPSSFIWKRLHSLSGIGLSFFITFHLFTNSQTALWIGDDGAGYIRSVNSIQEIPYLMIVEMMLLGLPLLIHGLWGLHYLHQSSMNSFGKVGAYPYLPEYGRNRAYTWQRITAWLLLVGIAVHLVHMRVVEQPEKIHLGNKAYYVVDLKEDPGLKSLAERLGVMLYDPAKEGKTIEGFSRVENVRGVAALAPTFGTAELLMVREVFKSPFWMIFYTFFVLAASFHGFNGLWSFSSTWGIVISERSQRGVLWISTFLMFIVAFLGLSSIYLTYWVNLRQ